jgi:hypothetical protein
MVLVVLLKDSTFKEYKMLKGWRTILVNSIPAILIVSDSILSQGYLLSFLINDPVILMMILLGVNLLNIYLRVKTDTPIGRKE